MLTTGMSMLGKTSVGARCNTIGVISTMTNGNVATTTTKGGVRQLTVTYNGGEQNILVPPTAPIVAFVPGAASIVEPGAAVFVNADEANGKTTAGLVAVGSHGLTPPF